MDCKNCNKQYIGKSKTPFRICLNNHRSYIKNVFHMSCMVTKHYTEGSTNCVFSQHTEFTIIEKMCFAKAITTSFDEKKKLDTLQRRKIFWPNKMKTHLPNGINKGEG